MNEDLVLQVGIMVGRHGGSVGASFDTEAPGGNMRLFKEAGLLTMDCDASLASLNAVLNNLADKLRNGWTLVRIEP